MSWFHAAKLGIFLHWGIYAVRGVRESWSFYENEIDYDSYMAQLYEFTAEHYDPKHWAELFKKAGARYVVLTSKHHDGVALWDTKASRMNVVEQSPAGRDLVGPYVEAMRASGLRAGIYYSHLDWSHPDYAAIHPHSDEWWATSRYTAPEGPDDYERWERFLQFHRAQLHELLTRYDVDLLWFDGVWERTEEQWRFDELNKLLRQWRPGVIINERIGQYGDYKCPEQSLPTVMLQGDWEFCMTLNDSWGYSPKDTNYKSLRQVVRIFTECIGMGGNLLLGIGPKPDGTIDERHARLLLKLGEWIERHAEAIYETSRGLPLGYFNGSTTRSADGRQLYLFYYEIPVDEICVKGIRNDIRRITVVGTDIELEFYKRGGFNEAPGLLWIKVPVHAINLTCTVIKVELEGPIDLYEGAGGGIK